VAGQRGPLKPFEHVCRKRVSKIKIPDSSPLAPKGTGDGRDCQGSCKVPFPLLWGRSWKNDGRSGPSNRAIREAGKKGALVYRRAEKKAGNVGRGLFWEKLRARKDRRSPRAKMFSPAWPRRKGEIKSKGEKQRSDRRNSGSTKIENSMFRPLRKRTTKSGHKFAGVDGFIEKGRTP